MPVHHNLATLGALVASSVLTVALFAARQAQVIPPSAVGRATISGVVRAATSQQPPEGAAVTLYGSQFADGRIVATTDDRGMFTFPGLTGGLYALGAQKDGFARVGYHQRRFVSGAPLFRLRDGEQMVVDLSLPLTSAVSGVVSDERGNPIAGATVRAFRYSMANGYLRPQDRRPTDPSAVRARSQESGLTDTDHCGCSG